MSFKSGMAAIDIKPHRLRHQFILKCTFNEVAAQIPRIIFMCNDHLVSTSRSENPEENTKNFIVCGWLQDSKAKTD